MSAIFMCDNCGEIFSVNQSGWKAFTETWDGDPSTRDVFNNAHNHQAMTRHIGPCCALVSQAVKPRIAIEGGKS